MLSGEECDHQHHKVFASLEDAQLKCHAFESPCYDKEHHDCNRVLDYTECGVEALAIDDDSWQNVQPFGGSVMRREDTNMLVLIAVDHTLSLAFHLQYTSQDSHKHGCLSHAVLHEIECWH